MKVAGMAEAFNMPVVSHLIPGDPRAPDGGDSEWADGRVHALDAPAVRRDPAIEDGQLVAAPRSQAWALAWDQAAIQRYQVA